MGEVGGDGLEGLSDAEAIAPSASAAGAVGPGEGDAVIHGAGEEGGLAPAGVAGDGDALGVDLGEGQQVVDDDAVPPRPDGEGAPIVLGVGLPGGPHGLGVIGLQVGSEELAEGVAAAEALLEDRDGAQGDIVLDDDGEGSVTVGQSEADAQAEALVGAEAEGEPPLDTEAVGDGLPCLILGADRPRRRGHVAVLLGEEYLPDLLAPPRPVVGGGDASAVIHSEGVGEFGDAGQGLDLAVVGAGRGQEGGSEAQDQRASVGIHRQVFGAALRGPA